MTSPRLQALHLEARVGSGPARRWLMLAAMAVLLALAGQQGLRIVALERQRSAQQERFDELAYLLERQAARAGQPAAAPSAVQMELRQRLTVPWKGLFDALDQAAAPTVSLLVLTPDAANRQLSLTVETASLEAALAYVDRLAAHPLLRQVHLARQEAATASAPGMAVPVPLTGTGKLRVEIVAQWRQP